MKIATWNVNGIRARQGQLIDWLAVEKPDVVCLQEIKASLDQLPFELRDMEHYWSYWHGEKGYSGVAILVSKKLVCALPVAIATARPSCQCGDVRMATSEGELYHHRPMIARPDLTLHNGRLRA